MFLKLGFTAFGGPAAHIGLMHAEIVERRKWLTDQEFLDLLGATNLIPGPNSTEMAIHVGFLRAGWLGLIVAGLCFIAPAMLMVLALAWAYVKFGSMPQAQQLLYGIKPVVIAIIAQAIWTLGRKAARTFSSRLPAQSSSPSISSCISMRLPCFSVAGWSSCSSLTSAVKRAAPAPRFDRPHWQPGHQHLSLPLAARPSACRSCSLPS